MAYILFLFFFFKVYHCVLMLFFHRLHTPFHILYVYFAIALSLARTLSREWLWQKHLQFSLFCHTQLNQSLTCQLSFQDSFSLSIFTDGFLSIPPSMISSYNSKGHFQYFLLHLNQFRILHFTHSVIPLSSPFGVTSIPILVHICITCQSSLIRDCCAIFHVLVSKPYDCY